VPHQRQKTLLNLKLIIMKKLNAILFASLFTIFLYSCSTNENEDYQTIAFEDIEATGGESDYDNIGIKE